MPCGPSPHAGTDHGRWKQAHPAADDVHREARTQERELELEALAVREIVCVVARDPLAARSLEPGHAEIPAWPAYDIAQRATLIFDRTCELAHAPLDAERAAWDGVI